MVLGCIIKYINNLKLATISELSKIQFFSNLLTIQLNTENYFYNQYWQTIYFFGKQK